MIIPNFVFIIKIFNYLIMKKMDPVVHFELPARDRKRMADFYSESFGWEAQMFGEEMGNYVTVSTVESDKSGRPLVPGAINGGLYPVGLNETNHHPSLVIAVEDIKESIRKVISAGGKILGEPTLIPGIGQYVSFIDTEGNTLSILQPLMT
jgi:predicted enzyme related to lactoylglutathione lyase